MKTKVVDKIIDLGLIEYQKAYHIQKEMVTEVGGLKFNCVLIFSEHLPVFTIGRSGSRENLIVEEGVLAREGISVFCVDRGGDITFHGPGQLSIYPIMNLTKFAKDIHWYLRKLEEATIILLDSFCIRAKRIPGLTGVWVDKKKIASIGIGIKRWISFHGISINVDLNMRYFSMIRPCGLDGIQMTSMRGQLNNSVDMGRLKEEFVNSFETVFSNETATYGGKKWST